MKITLVRHAQTEANYQNKIQGRSNNPLNDEGRRACLKLRDKLKDKHYDVCFMSPLARAVETAVLLIGDRVLTIPDNRLIERDMGEIEGKSRFSYDYHKYWDYNLNCSDQWIEPVQDIFKRCEDFLNYVKEKYPDGDILIVSHASPVRALHHILRKTDLNSDLTFSVENCYVEEIEIK